MRANRRSYETKEYIMLHLELYLKYINLYFKARLESFLYLFAIIKLIQIVYIWLWKKKRLQNDLVNLDNLDLYSYLSLNNLIL